MIKILVQIAERNGEFVASAFINACVLCCPLERTQTEPNRALFD